MPNVIEAQCSGMKCIASTEVPYSAKVTENLEFIDLKEPTKVWKEKMSVNLTRRNFDKEIEKAGYNIRKESKKLEKKYYDIYISKVKK